jgi:hypothetical protein
VFHFILDNTSADFSRTIVFALGMFNEASQAISQPFILSHFLIFSESNTCLGSFFI